MSVAAQRSHSQMGHMVVAPLIVTASQTLPPQNVLVHADTTAGAMTLTMPAASDALVFVPYVIKLEVDGGNLTVAYPGGTENPLDSVILGVDAGYVVAISDGTYWYELAQDLGS